MTDKQAPLEIMELLTIPTAAKVKRALELARDSVTRCEGLDWDVTQTNEELQHVNFT